MEVEWVEEVRVYSTLRKDRRWHATYAWFSRVHIPRRGGASKTHSRCPARVTGWISVTQTVPAVDGAERVCEREPLHA